jgi:hypothetical protein
MDGFLAMACPNHWRIVVVVLVVVLVVPFDDGTLMESVVKVGAARISKRKE